MSEGKIVVEVDEDLEDLIPGFLDNRKLDVDKLQIELENNNFTNICSIGHSLKGVGGGYGFDLMSQIGAEIETAAKASDMELIKAKISQLDDYLNRVEVKYA